MNGVQPFDSRAGFGGRAGCDANSVTGLALVSPFLRALLVTDGTVTRHLEAFFSEPIDVELVSQVRTPSERRHPQIELVPPQDIVSRRVVLRGSVSGLAYAFAETVVAIEALPSELQRGLLEDRKGIGQLLRDHRLETYREILDIDRRQAGEWAHHLATEATASVLVRSYRIFLAGRPRMQILEVFPESRFPC